MGERKIRIEKKNLRT
jgi:hypothetical protein